MAVSLVLILTIVLNPFPIVRENFDSKRSKDMKGKVTLHGRLLPNEVRRLCAIRD